MHILKYYKFTFYITIIILLLNCKTNDSFIKYSINTHLKDITPEMKTPGFWISKLENPDYVYLNSNEIQKFNNKIKNSNLYINDITNIAKQKNSKIIKHTIINNIKYTQNKRLFDKKGNQVDNSFFSNIKDECDITDINTEFTYCFFSMNSDLRIIPSDKHLSKRKNDYFFDELQTSKISIGTPGVIAHTSKSGKWAYVITYNVEGWTEYKNISTCSKTDMNSIINKKFIVITSNKADIFTDENLTNFKTYARMGSKFYLADDNLSENSYKIQIPASDGDNILKTEFAYIEKQHANLGYLDYTSRNIINSAFKLLNAPYGWGGMFGEQDCSQMLLEIFSTTGIYLPRNSSNQALSGKRITEIKKTMSTDEKNKLIINKGIPGITFLRLPGHIVLYLGHYNETAYVIHATWGYMEKIENKEFFRPINGVAVTNLSLGENSRKGSLLKKIDKMNIALYSRM